MSTQLLGIRSIAIIGGGGWLGRVLAAGILRKGLICAENLHLCGRSTPPEPLPSWPQVVRCVDNASAVARADLVILSVKPSSLPSVRLDATGKLLVSVMASTPMRLLRHFGTDRVVRCMPNAAAGDGRSYTPWYAPSSLSMYDVASTQALMAAFGESDRVPAEDDIDYLTALSGSGPAFPALLARAMISHARSNGVSPEIAGRAVASTLRAASEALDAGSDAYRLVREFQDYGGTTAAGINAMIEGGFETAVTAGVTAAAARAQSSGSA